MDLQIWLTNMGLQIDKLSNVSGCQKIKNNKKTLWDLIYKKEG
jgi:hypothetical protein